MKYLTEAELNQLYGKSSVAALTREESRAVLEHLFKLEHTLEVTVVDDMLGTEGWRHFVGYPED